MTRSNHLPATRTHAASCCLAMALLLTPAPGMADMTDESLSADFAFELIDPGFCIMPPAEMSDADLRTILSEQADEIPLTGDITAPVEAGLHGNGFFARGSGRNAVAATMHAMIVPKAGTLSALCLAFVPVNGMNTTDGDAPLYGPDSAPDEGDYYMAFARLLSREDGAEIQLGDLTIGEGQISFSEDMGDVVTGTLALSGEVSDGSALDFAFEFALFEEEMLRFVDLTGSE
ncbi:MAG: hypothetical protein JJU15_03565 [Pararhodobacter sp.]|nr:hypothetical protein [Pararhodobacter sp.]